MRRYSEGWRPEISPRGVLTDKWYTGMLKGFEVHFRKFWYIDGWVIVTYPMRPICKIGCFLENLAKKSTQFAPNWVLFAQKWYRDGLQNHAFRRYRDGWNFKLYFEHPRTNILEEPPREISTPWLKLRFINYSLYKQDK